MFEFEFTFYNSQEPFYVTHRVNYIDNELLQFLIQVDIDFKDIKKYTTQEL